MSTLSTVLNIYFTCEKLIEIKKILPFSLKNIY